MVLPPRLELGSREAADFKSAVFASFTMGALIKTLKNQCLLTC